MSKTKVYPTVACVIEDVAEGLFGLSFSNHNPEPADYFQVKDEDTAHRLMKRINDETPKRCCIHDSDCAIHNAPALPVGPCDCTKSLNSKVLQARGFERAITFQLDGNMWCATDSNFINLHESPAGFGETLEEALEDLFENELK